MLTDNGGRDHVTVAEAAFDADYRLAGDPDRLRLEPRRLQQPVRPAHRLGAGAEGDARASTTCRRRSSRVKGVYTNTTPIDAYRGAGRPEAIYVIERLMDWSARDLGLDPWSCGGGTSSRAKASPTAASRARLYDVGDFDRVLDRALAEADVAGVRGAPEGERARRAAARPRAQLLHRIDPRRTRTRPRDRLRRGRHGRARRRHPVERPGPRDGVRADPARAQRHPVRARSASCRATATASPRAAAPAARAR